MTISLVPLTRVAGDGAPGTGGRAAGDPVAGATAARPVLAEHAAEADRTGTMPAASIEAMRDAGVLRMLTPPACGGARTSLADAVEAIAEIARADSSAGWLTMILGCSDHLVGLFDPRAQAEIYADGPDTSVCAVFAPMATAERISGGWRIAGRWMPSSGCRHARWALLGFSDDDGGHRFALVPVSQLEILATWDVLGVRATASDTLTGTVEVPEHRTIVVAPALDGETVPPGHRALSPVLLTLLVAPFLGMATAALDTVLALAHRKGVTFTTYEVRAESTAFQMQVAEAATKIDAARALAHRAAQETDAHAASGSHPGFLERSRVRGWAGYAVSACREAVDLLANAQGAGGFATTSPFARIVRDIQTASRHAMAGPAANTEVYGRALLGVEPAISPLI